NTLVSHAYYVRTKAEFPAEYIDSIEVIDGYNYIVTKPMSVAQAHKVSDRISDKDGEFFFAGIKR
ncbi:MAG: hypothetical protein IKV40_02510, partial [Clostridia bacterium]|nr:hypothetical protein [Clostridia bacterium]